MRALLLAVPFALLVACSGAQGEIGGELADPTPGTEGGVVGDGGTSIIDAEPADGATEGTTVVGVGGVPFDPSSTGSTGVKLNKDGAIVIDPGSFAGSTAPLIWVANSEEGTVSKIDTRTMTEVARYRTGPGSPDPSRTTVALNGDVVVVNRGGASATKIAANPAECVGPGAGTSTGKGDVRAWGDDKCVLWNTAFAPGSLARAAAFDAEKGLDGAVSTSVWVGLWTSSKVVQLDSKTGKVLGEVDVAPIKPYGAAVDANHQVWVWGGGVGRIHAPTRAWKQITNSPCAYGIAVDPKGRVWTSGGGCVARYTPDTGTWDKVAVGASNRGLAVDAKGSVWVADTEFGVHQLNTESMAVVKDLPLGGGGRGFVGMAIDFDGKIWAINRNADQAFKIDPTTYGATPVTVGKGPYTYSDMTGFQLRNAADPFGKYLQIMKGCATAKWQSLTFKADVPGGTSITVRARTGKDLAALKAAAWQLVAKLPGESMPIDLDAKLGAAAKNPYIEFEFYLTSTTASLTPILSSIEATAGCPPAIN